MEAPFLGNMGQVNHGSPVEFTVCKATTEVPNALFSLEIGLCLNMRSLPWYVQANPNTFFPRCYGLCTESEKQEFLGE